MYILPILLLTASPTIDVNRQYYNCVLDQARQWVSSGEPASVIVTASLVSCETAKQAVKEWAQAQPNSTYKAVDTWLKAAQKVASEDATALVLTLRSKP